jgi:hypothetical protein
MRPRRRVSISLEPTITAAGAGDPRYQEAMARYAAAGGAMGDTAGGSVRIMPNGEAFIRIAYADPKFDPVMSAAHEAYHVVEALLMTAAEFAAVSSQEAMAQIRKVAAKVLGLDPAAPQLAALPDYENYRELLLTLPERPTPDKSDQAVEKAAREAAAQSGFDWSELGANKQRAYEMPIRRGPSFALKWAPISLQATSTSPTSCRPEPAGAVPWCRRFGPHAIRLRADMQTDLWNPSDFPFHLIDEYRVCHGHWYAEPLVQPGAGIVWAWLHEPSGGGHIARYQPRPRRFRMIAQTQPHI